MRRSFHLAKKPGELSTLEAKCGRFYILKITIALSPLQCEVNTAAPRAGACDYRKSETTQFLRVVVKGKVVQLLSGPFPQDICLVKHENVRSLFTLMLMLPC